VDDTLDVFPCHGVGGIVGMIATAVFAKDGGLITGKHALLSTHMIALAIVCGYTFVMAFVGYKVVGLLIPLRVSREHEDIGLDLSQHNESIELVAANWSELPAEPALAHAVPGNGGGARGPTANPLVQ